MATSHTYYSYHYRLDGLHAFSAALIHLSCFSGIFVLLLVLFFFIIIPLINLLWVQHNINIYRKKGPRKEAPTAKHAYEQDWEGRKIATDWEALKLADNIEIQITEEIKDYKILT